MHPSYFRKKNSAIITRVTTVVEVELTLIDKCVACCTHFLRIVEFKAESWLKKSWQVARKGGGCMVAQ